MGGWVYLDYSVSSGPFLKFSMRFEFLSEILYYSVCEIYEIRDPSLTIGINMQISQAKARKYEKIKKSLHRKRLDCLASGCIMLATWRLILIFRSTK